VSGSLAARGGVATARRAHWSRPCSCCACQPGGAGGRFDKNAVAGRRRALFWLSAFAELGTVTWHCPTGKPETTPCSGCGGCARLNRNGASTTTAPKRCEDAPWSVRLEPPGQRPAVLGLEPPASRDHLPGSWACLPMTLRLLAGVALAPGRLRRDHVSRRNTPACARMQNATQSAPAGRTAAPSCRPVRRCWLKIRPRPGGRRDDTSPAGYRKAWPGCRSEHSIDRLRPGEPPTDPDGSPRCGEEAGGTEGRGPLRARAQEVLRRLGGHAGPALPLDRRGAGL